MTAQGLALTVLTEHRLALLTVLTEHRLALLTLPTHIGRRCWPSRPPTDSRS